MSTKGWAMASSPSDLKSHAGFWLRYVSNHVSHAFARKLAARDVTIVEWVLMRELFDVEAAAPSNLADRLGMTRGGITKLVDRLIAKALITRRDDPVDGRARTLALTAKARRLVPELAKLADQNDAEFFCNLKQSDREHLLRILKHIVEEHGLKTIPIS